MVMTPGRFLGKRSRVYQNLFKEVETKLQLLKSGKDPSWDGGLKIEVKLNGAYAQALMDMVAEKYLGAGWPSVVATHDDHGMSVLVFALGDVEDPRPDVDKLTSEG